MYDEIKANKMFFIAGGILLVVLLAGAFLLGGDRSGNIHDNSGAADNVTEQLESAANQQHEAQSNIESAESGLDSSIRYADRASLRLSDAQSTVDRVTDRNTELADTAAAGQAGLTDGKSILDDSERRIAECQSILHQVQKDPRENGK